MKYIKSFNENKKISDTTISITKGKGESGRYKTLYSKSKWFDDCEWFQIIEEEDYLIIRKCLGIEIPKNAKKFTKARRFGNFVSEIPIGQYHSDESESNSDELVIPIN